MTKRLFHSIFGLLFVALVYQACKDPYSIPAKAGNNQALIVEGYLNANGQTTIKLSRSVEITSQYNFADELNAAVQIESDNSLIYPLTEQGKGLYIHPQISYPESQKYRLKITTKNGAIYYSEYVGIKKSPPIEQVFWERNDDGVNFYVKTADPINNTRYYRWEWEETWKFQMELKAELYFPRPDTVLLWSIDSLAQYPYDRICWQSEKSSQILIGSTEQLSQDVLPRQLIAFIPNGDWKLNDQFSIFVKQQAITRESYQYWEKISKNSSGLGSVYSPMPSEIKGNIYCASDPSLPVIGYFEASGLTEKRIFINSNTELRNWTYDDKCTIWNTVNSGDSIKTHIIQTAMLPYRYVNDTEQRIYYVARRCLDCKLTGTPVKPSFWP